MDVFTIAVVALLLGVVNTYLVLKLYVSLKKIPDITGVIDVILTILALLRTKIVPDEQNKIKEAEKLLRQVLNSIQKKQYEK
jgi:hypothetical protein